MVSGWPRYVAASGPGPQPGFIPNGIGVMNSLMTWLCVIIVMLFAAGVWFAYLVRIVLNDEVVQERRRRRMRVRELERRRAEDKAMGKRRKRV